MTMRKHGGIAVGALALVAGMAWGQATAPGLPPPPPAEAVVAPTPAPAVERLTLLQLLMRGGPVMYPLVLCSIVTVAFAIERALRLRRNAVLPRATRDIVARLARGAAAAVDPTSVQWELETRDDPLARVAVAGLRRAGRPLLEIERALEDAGGKEVARLFRNNRVLSGTASVTPLLGLLGTVTGIIDAFMTVAAHEEALGRTELLAGGIYEALVATGAGLAVAIAAMILYLYFQERVDMLATEIDETVSPLAEKLAPRA